VRAGDAPSSVRVHPASLAGTVDVPGDKSLSHRALIVGALAQGPVVVEGLAPSGDVASTVGALRALGAEVELGPDADGRLSGRVGPLPESDEDDRRVIDCGNSGTTLRLLAGVLAGRAGTVVLMGDASLSRRPVDRVIAPLRAMGAALTAAQGDRTPPLEVRGARLVGIDWDNPVASAQVKSAILLAATRATGTTRVVSPLASRDHTERLLAHFGAIIGRTVAPDGRETVELAPSRLSPRPVSVARDPSSAAFWMVAAACGAGTIRLPGLCLNPTRTGALDALEAMAASTVRTSPVEVSGEPVGDVTVTPSELTGTTLAGVRVVDAIDELPILALAGAMSRDGIEVRDAAELRVKESDRILTTARTLGALGVDVETRADGYRVRGGQRPGPGRIDAAGDHRIAMMAAIAAVVGTGPVVIDGFGAVATSYPTFLEDLERLGGRVDRLDP